MCSIMPGITSRFVATASTSTSVPSGIVHQTGFFQLCAGDDLHVFVHVLVRVGDDHILSAQYIRRRSNTGYQLIPRLFRFLGGKDSMSPAGRDPAAFQHLVKRSRSSAASAVSLRSKCGRQARPDISPRSQSVRQTERQRRMVFHRFNNIFHLLWSAGQNTAGRRCQLWVETGFRVVAKEQPIAFFLQCPNAVRRAIVKLDPCPIRIGPEPNTMTRLPSSCFDKFRRFICSS